MQLKGLKQVAKILTVSSAVVFTGLYLYGGGILAQALSLIFVAITFWFLLKKPNTFFG